MGCSEKKVDAISAYVHPDRQNERLQDDRFQQLIDLKLTVLNSSFRQTFLYQRRK
jgi:hypothetical protein